MARIDYLTAADLLAMDGRELNAAVKAAYADASTLLAQIDRTATGSGVVLDASGTGSWPRIVGSTEAAGHLANHPHHFTVPTTGDRRDRLEMVVAGWRGQVVGQARACERRAHAIAGVTDTLRRQLDAAGLDAETMYSDGAAMSTATVARKLVDIAIERIDSLSGGDLDNLARAALAMVPADVFTA